MPPGRAPPHAARHPHNPPAPRDGRREGRGERPARADLDTFADPDVRPRGPARRPDRSAGNRFPFPILTGGRKGGIGSPWSPSGISGPPLRRRAEEGLARCPATGLVANRMPETTRCARRSCAAVGLGRRMSTKISTSRPCTWPLSGTPACPVRPRASWTVSWGGGVSAADIRAWLAGEDHGDRDAVAGHRGRRARLG